MSAVRCEGLTCHYGAAPVLRDLDLTVGAGECLAVMAPNGAGKSTLLAAVAGVVPAWRGFVEIVGHRRRASPEEELAARQVCAYMPAEPPLATTFAAREWVVANGRVWGVSDSRLLAHADRLLRLFDLDATLTPDKMSTGQRQKLGLCAALATDAPVLVLDEPFAGGLDPSGIAALRGVLIDLTRRGGRTVLMATPVPELVAEVATRVAVLRDGRIVHDAPPAELVRSTGASTLAEAYEKLADAPPAAFAEPQTAEGRLAAYLEEEGGR